MKKDTLYGIITVILAGIIVLVCAIGSSWFTNDDITTWFNRWGAGTPPLADDRRPELIAYMSTGEPMLTGCKYELPKAMAYLERTSSEYADGGEITVQARTSNPYIKAKFDWSVKFANETDEWAEGKQATDYLIVEPTEDGSDTAKIKYLAKFATPLLVEASVRGSSGKSDSCTIDCLKSVSITDVTFGATDFDDLLNVYGNFVFGVGSVKGELSLNELTLSLSEDFKEAVQNYLTFDIGMKSYILNTISEVTESGNYIEALSDLQVDYSMFIQGFDDYDQRHKEAIYFAWYRAYMDNYVGGDSHSNVLFGYTFRYSYGGNIVQSFYDSDSVGNSLTGYEYGSNVQPDVVLNGNYVV